MELEHRAGMAPLTRVRATKDRIPTALMKEYYGQRASVPGILIVTEGTTVSLSASGGFSNAPGIWSEEQIAAWRAITDQVHRKGCFIFCQLFAMGRAANADVACEEGVKIVGPSAIPIGEGAPVPDPMTVEEVKQMVQDFVTASENAITAGFDGVEIHGANGYLADQFIQDVSNTRDDDYGGSIENRSRFICEILKAVVDVIGPNRVGLRLSPWSVFQGMRMEKPIPQFSDVISKANCMNLAYLHLIESRMAGADDHHGHERLNFAYELWNRPLLVAGGYKLADAQSLVDVEYPDKEIVVMFGRYFISNPDLVYRLSKGLKLTAFERDRFYTNDAPGYVDYPFSDEYLESESVQMCL